MIMMKVEHFKKKVREFKKLQVISLWILGTKHTKVLVFASIFRSMLALLDLVFIYMITAYMTNVTQGSFKSKYLSLMNFESMSSNQIMIFIASTVIVKNLGLIVLQKFVLTSLANREAEICTIFANAAISENDDLSKLSNSSELMQALLTSIPLLFNSLYKPIVTFIGELTTLIALSIALVIFNWQLAGFLFVFFFISGSAITLSTGRRQRMFGNQAQSLGRVLIQSYEEMFLMKSELKLAHKHSEHIRVNHSLRRELTRTQNQIQLLAFLPRYLLEILLFFGIAMAIIYMESTAGNNQTLIAAAVLVSAGFRLLPSLNSLIIGFGSFQNSESYLIKIEKLGKRFSLRDTKIKFDESKNDLITNPFNGDLVFENVTYRFPNSDTDVLRNFNLTLSQNKTLLVRGPSGSGKTTLIELASGILIPNEGKISMRKRGIDFRMDDSISGISYMRQDVPLFDESFGYNIAMRFVRDSDEILLKKVAETACIYQRILESPDFYKSRIGEKGLMLSAGERQRLGLARSLFSQPSLLILDEPTANLDSDSELLIWKSLKELKGTMGILIVSHKDVPTEVFDDSIFMNFERKF